MGDDRIMDKLGKWTEKLDEMHLFCPKGLFSQKDYTLCGKPMIGNNYAEENPDRTPCKPCMKILIFEGVRKHIRENAVKFDTHTFKLVLASSYEVKSDKHDINEKFLLTDDQRKALAFEWLLASVELWGVYDHFEDYFYQTLIDSDAVRPVP